MSSAFYFGSTGQKFLKAETRCAAVLRINICYHILDSLGLKAPSATWTYLVIDNPFEDMFEIQLIDNPDMINLIEEWKRGY